MAYIYPFRMTSTTATMLFIDPLAHEIIIGVRADNAWVFPGADSLPGGFMEARWTVEHEKNLISKIKNIVSKVAFLNVLTTRQSDAQRYHEGENSEDAAIREAREELSIDLEREQLRLFDVRANARTDTRAHVTNVCYYAELTKEQVDALVPGDDIKEIKRLPIEDLEVELPYEVLAAQYPMAFNHFDLMIQGLRAWQRERRYQSLEAEVALLRQRISDASWSTNLDRQGGI